MSQQPETALPPFLKWAGGKRWLVHYYPHLFPKKFERYVEPFLGGGAVFFGLQPAKSVLTDANAKLIECYQQIRLHPKTFARLMARHQSAHLADDQYYYKMRSKKFRKPITRAGQFLYLNRTCWNGLYRVNLDGIFNVPRGTKNTVVFADEDFEAYSDALKGARLASADYEKTLDGAGKGDFVFVDPPYTVKHNFNGFAKYNENIFSWADQERLRATLDRAAARGARMLLSNAHHESILELFSGLGKTHIVKRRSVIAGEPVYRSAVTEVAITINYEVDNTHVSDELVAISRRKLNLPRS